MSSVTEMNVAIAKALGLDPHRIRRSGVTIRLDAEEGPIVEVQYRATDENLANSFVGALVRYKLVELEDDEEPVWAGTDVPRTRR